MVTINYIRFEARSSAEAKKRAEKMFEQIEKSVPSFHKREFMIADVYKEEK